MLDQALNRIANWTRVRLSIPLGIVLILGACDQAAVPESGNAAEAERAFETYVAAINDGDTEKATQFYDRADGFHWVERGNVQYASGDEAAASLIENSSAAHRVTMKIDDLHSAPLGPGAALLSAHFTYSARGSHGSLIYSFDGWMTVGMVKRAEGWRIAGGQTGPGKSAAK